MEYKYKLTYLAEKDTQVEALAIVEEAQYTAKWKPAFNPSKGIAIVPLKGHVLTSLEPQEYGEKYAGFGESTLYVFPEEYKLKPGEWTAQILKTAVEILKNSERIIIATDCDNEGATLAMNVIRYAGVEDRVERMLEMGSTHPVELRRTIDNPTDIPYINMAEAGMSRAFIDWAEGMSISRALTHFLGGRGKVKLNFGGVKTPLIYMVVSRDLAYESHEKTYYWTATGLLKRKDRTTFDVTLKHRPDGGKLTDKFETEEQIKAAIQLFIDNGISIDNVSIQNKKTPPPQLYDLATIQGDMIDKFKLTPKEALAIGQAHYDFPRSIESYPRTEVRFIKFAEFEDVEAILKKINELGFFSKDIIDNIISGEIPKRKTTFSDKEVVAHGAIVPTLSGDFLKWIPTFTKQELGFFEFICRRYVANFMGDYEYSSLSGKTNEISGNVFVFSENRPLKAGWEILYNKEILDKISDFKASIPIDLFNGEELFVEGTRILKKETKPKPRYTMKTLLNAMVNVAGQFPDNPEIKEFLGESGIGTSATRDSMIDSVMSTGDINKGEPWLIEEKGKIISTAKARALISVLPVELVSPIKRAILSKKLKEVERGTLSSSELLDEYRISVRDNISLIKGIFEKEGAVAVNSASEDIVSLGTCPKCGKDIIEKKKVFLCTGADFFKDEVTEKWSNNGCTYTIFKSACDRFGKKNITAREVSNMLHKGKATVSLTAKKSGKKYNAFIIPNLKWGLQVDFDNLKKK